MIVKDFKVKIGDEEVEFTIKNPTLEDQREAKKTYNQAFNDAILSGSVVRAKIDELLKRQGLWDDEKQAEFSLLQSEIGLREQQLKKGGIPLKRAKEVAFELQDFRSKLRELISSRTQLDNHSAEGQADNAQFNYLVSACVIRKSDNSRYFSSLEDYLNKATDPVALAGAQTMASMMYNIDENYEKNLTENKFLRKYKFADDDLRLLDKDGRYVDREGKLVDKDGRYINDKNEYVDIYGNKVDKDGNPLDVEPFFDDEGKPVTEYESPTKDENKPVEPVKLADSKSELVDEK